ncbi:17735_t:CDS:2, partial [Cetraspora pellucida]
TAFEMQKLTNHINNILKLTDKGQEYVNQIQVSFKKNKLYHQLHIKIEGTYYPPNMVNVSILQITKINLIYQVQDQIIINQCADHQTTKTIKGKLLYLLNGADKKDLYKALLNSREICNNKKLERFIIHEDRRLKDYTVS